MHLVSLVLLAAFSLSADAALPPGTELTYRGTMVAAKEDGNPAKKSFDLTVVVGDTTDDGVRLLWTLGESGRGSWTWLDHLGEWTVDPKKRDDGNKGPALLYQREDGKSVVPLFPPLFASETKLEKGAAWSEGRMECRVTGDATVAERPCWEIDCRTPYGHKRTLWVAKDSPLVVAIRETVFIGQGQQHELKLELVQSKSLAAEATAKTASAFGQALKLRESLGWESREAMFELKDEQIKALREELPKLAEAAEGTTLSPLVALAQKDLQDQKGRAGAVAALRDAIVGKPIGQFKLTDLAGKEVTQANLKDKVTVLHFWTYRDTPLEEPYGQVGYLDFLLRKRGEAGAQVIGVLVDDRIEDEGARRSAISSARKLKAFMNLSYNIALDDGDFLKQLGDPRKAGGKLPVFVVVGKDGKILDYHTGLYDVKPDQGLAELDGVVRKGLGK